MIDVEAVQEIEADTGQLARLLKERECSLVEMGSLMENITGCRGASTQTSCSMACRGRPPVLCLVTTSNG